MNTGRRPEWTELLVAQLSWHWEHQARPRLVGLTDEEYRWEPVEGMWTIRRAGERMIIDWAFPPPDPAPVTTIAWRLAHVVVGVFGDRNARYFGGPAITYDSYAYPDTADGALADLDTAYQTWIRGISELSEHQLQENCREIGYENDPMASLILHIHREAIHHLAEIALMRDLYRAREPRE